MSAAAERVERRAFEARVNAVLLAEALAGSVAVRRGAIPIFGHALIECEGTELRVTTSDSVRTITRAMECVGTLGRMTGDVVQLRAALTGLSDDIELREHNDRLLLVQGRRRFRIDSLPPEDFPMVTEADGDRLEVDPVAIGEALRAVAYCARKDDTQPHLNGATVQNDYVVAGGGHRLAAARLPQPVGTSFSIPPESIDLIAEHCARGGEIWLYRPRPEAPWAQLTVRNARAVVRTRLLEGHFPESWRSMLGVPEEMQGASFAPGDMLTALTRLAPFWESSGATGKKYASVRVRCTGERLEIASPFIDDCTDEIACEGRGEPWEINMDPRYLTDVMRQAKGARVAWGYRDPNKGHIAQVFTTEEGGAIHLVAPQRR